jgi:hypothetical protein
LYFVQDILSLLSNVEYYELLLNDKWLLALYSFNEIYMPLSSSTRSL